MTVSRPPTLDARKRALLDALLTRDGATLDGPDHIPRRPLPDRAPLSFAQQRLWFLSRLDPASAAYNVPLALPFRGPLQIVALERTLNELVRRHEVLRTHFELDRGEPVQRIAAAATLTLPVIDLATQGGQSQEAARRLAAEEAARPFDLARAPLLRACLLRVAPDDHVLLLTLHHIVTDAWSMDVLAREMSTMYAAFAAGRRPSLPDLPVQYADYAAWQRGRLLDERLGAQLEYWRTRLAGAPVLELPTDRPRPPVATNRGAARRFTLPASLAGALRSLAQDEGVTLFMLLLAVFKVLLHRYSAQDNVVVGSPIAGRIRPELEPLVGFFVNSLVLRTALDGNPPFREVLQRVRETALGAFAHQELPFEKLVEALQPNRDLSRNPLFQVIFQLLRSAPGSRPSAPAFAAAEISAKFDLSFTLQDQGAVLEAFVEYNADLYDADTVERMCTHYATLAQASPRTRTSASAQPPCCPRRRSSTCASRATRPRRTGRPTPRCTRSSSGWRHRIPQRSRSNRSTAHCATTRSTPRRTVWRGASRRSASARTPSSASSSNARSTWWSPSSPPSRRAAPISRSTLTIRRSGWPSCSKMRVPGSS